MSTFLLVFYIVSLLHSVQYATAENPSKYDTMAVGRYKKATMKISHKILARSQFQKVIFCVCMPLLSVQDTFLNPLHFNICPHLVLVGLSCLYGLEVDDVKVFFFKVV